MENKNIILVVVAVLVVAALAIGLYSVSNGNSPDISNVTDSLSNITKNNATDTTVANNTTNKTVGDNSTRLNTTNNNTTYKVYNPQSDSYVEVIGEKFDDEVNRWYTYDTDGVRYYNTRINK